MKTAQPATQASLGKRTTLDTFFMGDFNDNPIRNTTYQHYDDFGWNIGISLQFFNGKSC